MVTEILFDNCFKTTIKTNLVVVLPSNLLKPQWLTTTDKDNTLGKNAVIIFFVQGKNLSGTEADLYLSPRPKQNTRAELEPTQGLVKELCLSIWELVKQLRLYIQHCLQRLVLQIRWNTPDGSRKSIYLLLSWLPINEVVEVFSLLRGNCYKKWPKDVDIGIVVGIGLIQSLGEPEPS